MSFVEADYGASEGAALVEVLLVGLTNAKLVCKSTVEEDEGKTIVVTDGVTAVTRKFNSNLTATFDLAGKAAYKVTVSNAGVTEFETIVHLSAGEYKEIEVGLNTNTWTGLKNIVNAHLETTYCNIGDEINVTLNTKEVMTYRIAAINHDQPHQLIFEPRYCMETTRQMNPSNTNVGGWNACTMREWLNGVFYQALPDELKAVISERTFKTSIGNQGSALQEATDKIWLLKEWEVFGTQTYATATEHTSDTAQLPIYAVASNRVKTYGKSGGSALWWLSSPHSGNDTNFCIVTTAGAASNNDASNSRGVVPCFQIVSSES